jgi:hypothetical protein
MIQNLRSMLLRASLILTACAAGCGKSPPPTTFPKQAGTVQSQQPAPQKSPIRFLDVTESVGIEHVSVNGERHNQ